MQQAAYLQVPFRCKGSPTDGAGKWLFPCMRPLVNLQGAGGGEVLPTRSADVLFGWTAELRSWHQKRGNTRGESWWANEMASANGTLTWYFHFYEGWWGSNKSSWNTISTLKEKRNIYIYIYTQTCIYIYTHRHLSIHTCTHSIYLTYISIQGKVCLGYRSPHL